MESVEKNHSLVRKNRVIYFDILNIIAIISVIALHCSGDATFGNIHNRAWKTGMIIECICYFAVPLFCMLSGATLMNYREKYDTKTFFKKRIFKVLIPFVFWAIVMFIWNAQIHRIDITKYNNWKSFLNAFFANKEEATYYFMFEILGIYLTMPLLSLVAKEENRKSLWLVVFLFFIFNSFLPNILVLFKIYWNASFSVKIGDYIIFVILGYLLSKEDLSKSKTVLLCIGAIIGLIYRDLTTYYLSFEANQLVKATWGYASWHSILLTCSVFVLIKKINFDSILLNKRHIVDILSKIASCSFGIYLIHIIVIYYEKKTLAIDTLSIKWRILGVFSTYIISLGIVYILKQIPIIKKVLP